METTSLPKVAIYGALGRMGKRLCCLSIRDAKVDFVGGIIEPSNPSVSTPLYKAIPEIEIEFQNLSSASSSNQTKIEKIKNITLVDDVKNLQEKPDVIIDFSTRNASLALVKICVEEGIAWVCGTTGFTEEEREEITKTIKEGKNQIPWMIASNFSLGINILRIALKQIASNSGSYFDVEMTETHHTRKKDKPSGTAITLRESVYTGMEENKKRKISEGESNEENDKKPKEIDIHALRMADIYGEHSIFFANQFEKITIQHEALSRDLFADGAIFACKWIVKQVPQRYDILNLFQ